MPAYLIIVAIIGSFGFSVCATYLVKRYVEKTGLLDTPNSRSSHSQLTPSGGGLSMVVTLLLAGAILTATLDKAGILIPVMAAIVLLAITGWMDDRHGLSVGIRFIVYIIVALYVIYSLGSFDRFEIGEFSIGLGSFSVLFTIGWIVWLINLYNFMDGIDGLAATQSAVAGCTLGIWFTLHKNYVMALFCYVIMAVSLGFLVWNWAPARIFMGDVGSVTLGGLFAILAVLGQTQHDIPLGACVLLLGVFIADTTVTLLRRALRGERVWQAHRSHFYQRAVRTGYTHARVTGAAAIIAVVLAIFATLEMLRVFPQGLWAALSAALLAGTALYIVRKEQHTGA